MTVILDQQIVFHLFAFADGPGAAASYRAITEIWRGCRLVFGMTEPVPGLGLPQLPSSAPEGLSNGGEIAFAAQESPGADCQAILRRHHDVLNLSVALAPPEATAPRDGDWPWWRSLSLQWEAVTAEHVPHLLGEARIFQARIEREPDLSVAAAPLYMRLKNLLPAQSSADLGWRRGVSPAPDLALWECGPEADDRAVRAFALAIGPESDSAASSWIWSRGDPAIPPLARYLLNAAKLRYQSRVWHRDSRARELQASLDAVGTALRQLGADDQAEADMLRVHRLDTLLFLADLKGLRQSVEAAVDNLGRAFDLSEVLVPGGPFADDTDLGRSLLERLDDELGSLTLTAERAVHLTDAVGDSGTRAAENRVTTPAEPPEDDGRSRRVFVVHGRDEAARSAVFALLRALGLHPQEWEDLVAATGKVAPYLGEVIAHTLPLAQAVVVVMTPDDVVRLHPDLGEENGDETDRRPSLQARPNVLIELGMALAVHPDRTLMLLVGDHRAVSDLGGRNFVQVSGNPRFREKVAFRLRLAGCPVDLESGDWRTAGDFAALTALRREPR